MKCYAISGLGADKRAFKYLDCKSNFTHIDWLNPMRKESLTSYCQRLSKQIDQSEPFILIGLSFGGLIACEISKLIKPKQLILISSLVGVRDLPLILRIVSYIQIHRIIPLAFLRPPMFVFYWLFSINNKSSKKLLKGIIRGTDLKFLKWAIRQILELKVSYNPKNLIRIHGKRDRIIPLKINADNINWIEDGGHFMIVQKAPEINELLKEKMKP